MMFRRLATTNSPEEDIRAGKLREEFHKQYDNLTKEELVDILVEQEVEFVLFDEANDKATAKYEAGVKAAYERERDNWKYAEEWDK
jgi:glutamine synthetase